MKTVQRTRQRPPGRPTFPLRERRRHGRSITVGIIGTILFHLLFVFSLPSSYFLLDPSEGEKPYRQFDIEIISEPEEEEPRYVETNPNAADNEPDNADNFSARNQQAANEEAPDDLSPDRTPATEGEDLPSNKIISGDLNPPVPSMAPPQEEEISQDSLPTTLPSNPEKIDPLPGFEDDVIVDDEGTGMTEAEESARPTEAEELVEGIEADTNDDRPFAVESYEQTQRPVPQPRPRLPRSPPGPIRKQSSGVSATGAVAYDAKFSQFGDYMERMIEVVTQRWHALAESRSYREISSTVRLEFRLHEDGRVDELVTVDTNSRALGILLCRSAIEQGAPYSTWPQDMRDVLGESQTITFTFFYR
ncbi:MAG: hypothetical protein DRP71_17645 [Verrucomicrobia bacterium]|nr:MAG: hypothetical protein DRP71_17645 [Verrucomicrobiota bacterium]